MKTFPRLFRVDWRLHLSEVGSLLVWVLVVGLLETLGGRVEHDFGDGVAMLGVVCAGLLTHAWHSRSPLRWALWLAARRRRALRWLRRWRLDLGVDLRGEPPLPRSIPRPFWQLGLWLAGAALLLVLARSHFPHAQRDLLTHVSYSVYLLYAMLLWGSLLLGTLFFLFVPSALVHDRFVKYHGRRRGRPWRGEMLTLSGGFLTVALLATLVPSWVPLAVMASLFATLSIALLLPTRSRLVLIWRKPPFGIPHALQWSEFALLQLWIASSGVVLLLVLARGDLIGGGNHWVLGPLVVTPGLGFVFSWAALAGMLAFTYQIGTALWLRRQAERCPRIRPVLFANGVADHGEKRRMQRALRASGFDVRFAPASPRAEDVKLHVYPAGSLPERRPFEEEQWPLPVSIESVALPGTLRRLARRDTIQKRRRIVRALKRLFKEAAAREFHRGEGYWVGLQHWFVSGLSRDRAEEGHHVEQDTFFDDTIGPPFRQLLDWPAREHFREVTRALHVDLIFVADKVGYPRLRRVLECLFEIHDIFGADQRAEEKHFVGLPGTRVILHDFVLDHPFRSKRFPEPDYEDIGRARILHVFRDTGGEEDPDRSPREWEDLSLPRTGGFLGF